MAVDPKAGGDGSGPDWDDDSGPMLPRAKANPLKKRLGAMPSVESSLDDFISRATEKAVDTDDFKPENREQELREEITTLSAKLAEAQRKTAAAERRAADAEVAVAAVPRPKRWPAVIGGFVIGAAAMFAVSLVLPKKDEATVAPAGERRPAEAPDLASQTPAGAKHAPEAAPTEATPTETAPAPPTPTVTPTQAVATTGVAAKRRPGGKHEAVKPPADKPPADKPPADKPPADKPPADKPPADKPPAEKPHSGSDGLYNPF